MKKKYHIIPCIFTICLFSSCKESSNTSTTGDSEVEMVKGASPIKISGNVPTEVIFAKPLYPDGPSDDDVTNRTAFDEFSWKTFIALSWPVKSGAPGIPLTPNNPNTFLKMSNTTPIVWTSYKNQWDLFNQGSKEPSAWGDPSNPVNVCDDSNAQHRIKHSFLSSMAGELNESFSVPLVDQNKNYVYFEIRYNKVQYDFIRDNGLYDNKKLLEYQEGHNNQVQMPISTSSKEGSIMVKAAWKVLEKSDDESRFYVIDEEVYDPVVKRCHKMKLGLIGFHIAQKVDGFSQWVWSSFEQIDNVPGSNGGAHSYSLNNGTNNPSTGTVGYANKPDADVVKKEDRKSVQVTRVNEIPTTPVNHSTVDINKKYQKLLKGTWMEYYELVITQWPADDTSFKLAGTNRANYPKDCGEAFPVADCVNTTMETYFQTRELAMPAAPFAPAAGNSCMGCHYGSSQTDFSFSLKLRSHNMIDVAPIKK